MNKQEEFMSRLELASGDEFTQIVKVLQDGLKVRGFYNGPIDGDFGPLSESALGKVLDPGVAVNVVGRGEPGIIYLPEEAVPGSMVAFYGKPYRDPEFLDWFNFPTHKMRLYDRGGSNLSDHDGDAFDDHRCHSKLVEPLQAAFRELWNTLGEERFFSEGWHVYAGCFNYRRKKAGSGHSVHSWGAAIDLTAWGSGLFTRECGFSIEGVEIMEAYGFLWGPRAWGLPGEYENPKHPGQYFDAMHFQAAIPYLNPNSYYAKRGLPDNIRRWKP